ncbi:52 kDa repressor of the inhibitor of the protein kinase-like isoform X2 [Cydia pomonella]|uniref:52 kDa repressor of the inhibitor of the protein kinase-like isoform X2 n=1 Tax=Cydia pomonella TaxID=82600 RepID=UPI002ADDAC5E|nr:52 kDa repressor of the inhibitor of the protein kinase-like isoform X2 [Cydia pomonella]
MASTRANSIPCSADGCRNNKKNKNLSFFSLPTDEEQRNRWLEIIGRTDLIEKKDLKPRNYVVCSAHFEKDMIIQTPRLKPEALPTKYIPDVPTTCPDKTTTDGTTQTNLDVNITSDNKNVSTYKTVETQTDEARNDTAQTSIGVSTGILRKRKLRTGIQDPEENKRKLELVKKKIMRLQKIEKELEGDTSHSHSGW